MVVGDSFIEVKFPGIPLPILSSVEAIFKKLQTATGKETHFSEGSEKHELYDVQFEKSNESFVSHSPVH
jgi:hypothetical protein